MSASEKLKALDAEERDSDLWFALPQIVAVVEAAEAVEFQQHEPWADEYKAVVAALAALEEALS